MTISIDHAGTTTTIGTTSSGADIEVSNDKYAEILAIQELTATIKRLTEEIRTHG